MLCFLNSMITIVGMGYSLIFAYTNSFKNDAQYVEDMAT